MRWHINRVHKLAYTACTKSLQSVQLQSWFKVPWAKYWIVKVEESNKGTIGEPDLEGELFRLEQQEIQRLEQLEQDCIAQEAELEDSDNSP
jgi:hypothetical protein